jgi:hypothetical protein
MLRLRIAALLAVLGVAFGVSGCGSIPEMGASVGETVPHWAGGEPAGAPPRSATQPPYPAVNDMPPARNAKLITVQEQTKIESELAAARSQVSSKAATLEQQSKTEASANKDLETRASAARSKAERLRQQRKAEESEQQRLEAIARGRKRDTGPQSAAPTSGKGAEQN